MSKVSRAYASMVKALEILNESGQFRAVVVTATVETYSKVVLHGNVDLVRGLVNSNMLQTTEIHSDHATVTLPLVDYSGALDGGIGEDKVRAVTEGLEAESRPRKNLYQRDKGSVPPFWPTTIEFSSLNKGNRKKLAHEVLQSMQDYAMKRLEDILEGKNLEKYDRTSTILEDDSKKLSAKQRESREKRDTKRAEVDDLDREVEGDEEEDGRFGDEGKESAIPLEKETGEGEINKRGPRDEEEMSREKTGHEEIYEMEEPAAKEEKKQAETPLSATTVLALAQPVARPSSAASRQRLAAMQHRIFERKESVPVDLKAPKMRLGQTIQSPPPKKVKPESVQEEKENTAVNTFRITAKMRGGEAKILIANRDTTAMALLRQCSYPGPAFLYFGNYKIPHSTALLSIPDVIKTVQEGKTIVVDVY